MSDLDQKIRRLDRDMAHVFGELIRNPEARKRLQETINKLGVTASEAMTAFSKFGNALSRLGPAELETDSPSIDPKLERALRHLYGSSYQYFGICKRAVGITIPDKMTSEHIVSIFEVSLLVEQDPIRTLKQVLCICSSKICESDFTV